MSTNIDESPQHCHRCNEPGPPWLIEYPYKADPLRNLPAGHRWYDDDCYQGLGWPTWVSVETSRRAM